MLPRLRSILTLLVALLIVPILPLPSVSAAAGGPVVLSTYPSDNDTAVPANAQLRLVFDEPVTRGSGTIAIKEVTTNNTVDSLDVAANTSQVQLASANTVVVTPTSGRIQPNVDYYVQISPNAFGGASAGYAGISDATTWNFRTVAADTAPPQVSGTYPANGAPIASTEALVLTFNERVNAASGSIRIVRRDNQDTQVVPVLSSAVSGSGTVNASGRTEIRIQPPIRLAASATYDVFIDAGAFVDQVGNAYGGISSPGVWSFQTAAPAVAAPALSPANNASSVDPNTPALTLTFASSMQKGTGKIYVKRVSDNAAVNTIDVASGQVAIAGGTVSVQLSPLLSAGTAYYVQIDPGALKDAAGRAFDGYVDATSWRFTTAAPADTSPPAVTSLSPASGGSTAALNSKLVIQFNKPVWPGAGAITIRNVGNNSVFCTLNVTSGSVTGGGTNTITITPCANFSLNQTYAVQIPTQAFVDQSNHFYAGISSTDTTTWRFAAAQDSTVPELVGTSPKPQANSVAQDAVLRLTFNEPVQVMPGFLGEAVLQTSSGNGAAVQLALAVAADDPKSVTLTPVTVDPATGSKTPAQYAKASQYIVRVPEGAIADLAGNRYPGIMNAYRWIFSTIGSDTTPPSLQSAVMDGAAIVLTYNEDMDAGSPPYASNFYVTVNDVPRQVNSVTISGPQVRLQLQSGVTVGQKVLVSYTLDTRKLQDLSGNPAASFRDAEVKNTIDTTVPKPTGGSVDGNVLTLTFSKSLADVSSSAVSQFTVKLGGSPVGISSLSLSGQTATFVLSGSATNSAAASVSYSPGGYPLYDASGNAVAAFADFYVRNVNDSTPPQLVSGTVSGTKVTLAYNEGLDPASVPLKSSFSIIAGEQAASVSAVEIGNNTVALTLAQTVSAGQRVLITYIPGTQPIQDLSGNKAAAFSSYAVVSSGTSAVQLTSAVTDGTSLVLNYSGSLNGASIPNVYQYSVMANGSNVTVSSVAVSGSQVTLRLASVVTSGQQITVSYTPTGVPLQDASGSTVDPLTRVPVSFSSTAVGGTSVLPDYLGLDGAGGLLYKPTAAATSQTSLPSGAIANRYTLDQQKTTDAFTLWRQGVSGSTLPQLTFAVPQTEIGAIVAVPLQAVLEAKTISDNAAIRVTYKGITFTLPLDVVGSDKLLQSASGNVAGSNLVLKIEQTNNATLSTRISQQGAQLLATPVTLAATIMTSGGEQELAAFDAYASGSIVPTVPAPASGATVVRLDSESNELSYVPADSGSGASSAAVQLRMRSGGTYAVIAKTPTVYGDMRNHWASSDVAELAAKFIVDGPTSTTFAPKQAITRADFARFIAKGLGLVGNRSYATMKFSDVNASTSGAAYIGAAVQAGIVQGDAAGKFRPSDPITREEMAAIMQRAMTYAGKQPSPAGTELSRFGDGGQVSSWAKDAANASIQAGLMNGSTDGKFHPKSDTTRAEAAVIVKRLLEYVELL